VSLNSVASSEALLYKLRSREGFVCYQLCRAFWWVVSHAFL